MRRASHMPSVCFPYFLMILTILTAQGAASEILHSVRALGWPFLVCAALIFLLCPTLVVSSLRYRPQQQMDLCMLPDRGARYEWRGKIHDA